MRTELERILEREAERRRAELVECAFDDNPLGQNYLSATQAAQLAGVTIHMIDSAIRRGHLRTRKDPDGIRTFILLDSLADWSANVSPAARKKQGAKP